MNHTLAFPTLNDLIGSLQGSATVDFGDWPRTQDELRDDVARIAQQLRSIGVSRGDRVGILARTDYWWLVSDLACIALGAISVPFDATHTWKFRECIERYRLNLLITDRSDGNNLLQLPSGWRGKVCPRLAELVEDAGRRSPASLSPARFSPHDMYTVKFSSGTSQELKAIGASAQHFDHTAEHISRMFGLDNQEAFLLLMPLTVWLQRTSVLLCLWHKVPIVFGRLERAVQLLQKIRPSVVIGVPQLLQSMRMIYRRQRLERKAGEFRELWGGRIRCVWTGTAPISRELLEFYASENVPVYEGYGMAETGMIAKNYPGCCRMGSVGRPFPDKHLEFDADGQIFVRSRFHAASTYLDEDAPTGSYRPGGIVATGDIGHLDEDGFLYIEGRVSDVMVLANGRKVHPRIVEDRLMQSPWIANCCVYGHNRPWLSAVIVPADQTQDQRLLKVELARLNAGLEPYQRVFAYVLCDSFTAENQLATSTGKASRGRIHSRFHRELEALYEIPLEDWNETADSLADGPVHP